MTEQTSIGANDGIIVTTVGATPSSGPFAIDFPFDNLDDVIVSTTDSLGVQTILTRGLHYSITATVNGDGLYPSGTLTLVTPVANVALARWRSTPLERSSQLPLTGYLDRAALNSDLNRMMMAMQDFERRYGRYIRLPDDDPVVNAVVPAKSIRAGKTFIWDANGEPDAGELVTLNVVLNDFWRLTVLPTSTAPTARTALGAAGLTSANSFSAPNSFSALSTFTAGATFTTLSPTVPTPAPADDSSKVANTAWVHDEIVAALAPAGGLTTVPTIVELTSGSGTWTVPAGVKWFDVEMVGGGGGGGSNVTGSNGSATTFGGISVAGGSGGLGYSAGGVGGLGGLGGIGGTGTGTATTIIRKPGAPGANGPPTQVTSVDGVGDPNGWGTNGGNGAASILGGAPGRGGIVGAGTAGAANSGAGGGGYGNQDGTGGAGGGGAGESGLLRYATVAASYSWTVGAGAVGAAGNSSGGSGYIRIRCHFNY